MTNNLQTIEINRAILLVMDYQPAILSRINEPDELLSRVAGIIDTVRDSGMRVGYVRVAFNDTDYAAIPDTNKTFSQLAAGRFMDADNPVTAVHEAVAPQSGDIIVRKTRVGAFSTTDLNRQLRDAGIDTLILAGISTSGVVLSTVREAADLDYRIFVLADCCVDPEPQVHEVLITKIFPRQAEIIESDALVQLLEKKQQDAK